MNKTPQITVYLIQGENVAEHRATFGRFGEKTLELCTTKKIIYLKTHKKKKKNTPLI